MRKEIGKQCEQASHHAGHVRVIAVASMVATSARLFISAMSRAQRPPTVKSGFAPASSSLRQIVRCPYLAATMSAKYR